MAKSSSSKLARAKKRRQASSLHGALAAAPLGIFLLIHLLVQHSVTKGPKGYALALQSLWDTRGAMALEAVVLVMIFAHAVGGIFIALTRGHGYPYRTKLSQLLQPLSGGLTLGFVFVHIKQFTIAHWKGVLPQSQFYAELVSNMSATSPSLGTPGYALFYLVGLAGACFHASHGLWHCLVLWGFGDEGRRHRALAIGCGLLGFSLFLVGLDSIVHLATGAPLIR